MNHRSHFALAWSMQITSLKPLLSCKRGFHIRKGRSALVSPWPSLLRLSPEERGHHGAVAGSPSFCLQQSLDLTAGRKRDRQAEKWPLGEIKQTKKKEIDSKAIQPVSCGVGREDARAAIRAVQGQQDGFNSSPKT